MRKLLPIFALFILFGWGCEQFKKKEASKETPSTAKTVVARVNGRPIYKEDLKGKPLETAIDYEILYEAGLKKGLDKQFQQQADEYKKKLIISSFQQQVWESTPKKQEMITDEEIMEYYKQNQSKYKLMRVKALVVEDDKALADEIQKKALTGEDFDKIASEYAQAGKKVSSRDLGGGRRYNQEFEGKEVGAISEVVQNGNQFLILKLIEVKELPFDKIKQGLKYNVMAMKRGQAVHDFAEKIKKENNIKVEIVGENK